MREWDLRELVLLTKWKAEGHEFRSMGDGATGAVLCLRCSTIVHVSSRARAMIGIGDWSGGDPSVVKPCSPD